MKVTIKDNSDLWKKAKNQAVAAALEAIGQTAERHAKENCPVDTGLLRNSITHAVSGETINYEYKATYGENKYRAKDGTINRYSARAKKAGTVKSGSVSGSIGKKDEPAVYIGTNVAYARKQEMGDSYHHNVGQAHFLRDAVSNHGEEYNRVASVQLRKVKV